METNSNTHAYALGITVVILLLLIIVYQFRYKNRKDGFVQFIRYFLLPFTFLSGFLVYFIGYQVGNSHCEPFEILPNFLEAIFSTTRLFILGNDLVEIKDSFKEGNSLFHAMFALTAALAAFIFISFMAQVFMKSWLTRLAVCRKQTIENHFFFGISQSTLSLSTNLIKNNCKRLVVFVNDLCQDDNQHLYTQLPLNVYEIRRKSFLDDISLEKEEGLFQFLHDKKNHAHPKEHKEDIFHNLKVLVKKLDKAETHLYFLTNDEDWNIKYARLALNAIKNCPNRKAVRIHVSTYTAISEKHFAEYSKLSTDDITVIVHHYASVVSRELIAKHHPVDSVILNPETASATSDFNALIIGFGQIGTNILRKLIEQGQFVGSTFHATIIDKYMNILQGRFEHLYPGVIANYDLNFVEAEVGHSKFYFEIKKVVERLNYIVISLGNDNLNMQTALEILEINSIKDKKSLKILIKLEDESHWKETLNNFKDQLYIFGESDKVFSENNILQSEAEKRGRLVHCVYSNLYNDQRPFDKITRHEQLSNISVAEHLRPKVMLLGYAELAKFTSRYQNNDEYKNSLSEVQKLNLSIGEHLRWNAFHFIHGWTTIPFNQIQGATPKEKYKNRKNTDLRQHSCLASWQELEKLKEIIGEDMQKADIDSVENLYNFINYNPQNNNA